MRGPEPREAGQGPGENSLSLTGALLPAAGEHR
jgi:hypothetical protein